MSTNTSNTDRKPLVHSIYAGKAGRIGFADVCVAPTTASVGTKITNLPAFMRALDARIIALAAECASENEPFPAKPFFVMNECLPFIESGDVEMEVAREAGFIGREWRGWPMAFADGNKIAPALLVPKFCGVSVYSRLAYMTDPDVEAQTAPDWPGPMINCDYVVVIVIGSRAAFSAVPVHALVHNIAGGNADCLLTGDDGHDAQQARKFRKLAADSEMHAKAWITVAR